MNQLLKIEWLKVKRYTTFWVIAGLFIVTMTALNILIAKGILPMSGDGKHGPSVLSSDYSFPRVWVNIGWWSSLFINFLAILVIIVTTNEFVYRTNRQNVIDGYSKMQFFNAKILTVFAISLAATLYFFVAGAVFGRIYSGSFKDLFVDIKIVGYFFILTVDYLGLAVLLALLIRRSGLAICLFLLYSMFLENIFKWIININAPKPYGNLLMLQASDELFDLPLSKMANTMIAKEPLISTNVLMLTAMGWCVVYYFICRAILLRKDW